MNKQEVMETLKSKGFDVREIEDDIVIASLNRPIHVREITAALDDQIDEIQLVNRNDGSVAIICVDEDDDIPSCFGTHQYYDIG